ncbi:MAG: endopeptidase La [Chloroflexota bacterium]|nr:endopeptidase La [Chloroflexota bacterium]
MTADRGQPATTAGDGERPTAAESAPASGRAAIPDVLPILPLRETVVFPDSVAPLVVGQERSLRLVDDALRGKRLLGLVSSRESDVETPEPDQLYRVGTVANIIHFVRAADGGVRMVVQGVERIRLVDFAASEPYLLARVEPHPDQIIPAVEAAALRRAMIDLLQRLVPMVDTLPRELPQIAESIDSPRQLGYLIASALPLSVEDRQRILEQDPLDAKLRSVVEHLQHELTVRELGRTITSRTEERLTKAQREHILREQLRSIQAELGEGVEGGELDQLRKRVEAANLPDEARREVSRELDRLASIPEASPEYGMVRTWLELMGDLPWSKLTGADIDIARARAVLDEDHYDLEEVKDRILEYLAVRRLRRQRAADVGLAASGAAVNEAAEPVPSAARRAAKAAASAVDEQAETPPPTVDDATIQPTTPDDERSREPIMCFVGPPGVGKTSLGQSIARALGRKFIRLSLGGVRDEAEIRGHRRTYIGAMPGRIIQGIRRVGTRDPVFMLDEIDKVGADWRGDPTSALLEVLDPAQNNTFTDNYLSVAFDLSQVLFIATANTLETIPAPLLDRMEVLRIAGYTEAEKIGIAQRYLIPQQVRAHGLREEELRITDEALHEVTRGYTREAGVRDLDRRIAAICRKVARRIAEAASNGHRAPEPVVVTPADLVEYLGQRRHFDETAERTERPGVATGLAWTPEGGEILFVEAAMVPDGGDNPLLLTGMLGDVMRESAQAALTYVQSEASRFGVDPAAFSGKRIHVHVPAGALPKDGPSAGVAIVTAICSLALGRPVREEVAMTGEITLRGKVLPVGGIKEKVLAAHRAGVRTVLLPRRNEADLDDVPEELRRQMNFVLVDTADEVLAKALGIEVPEPAIVGAPA